MPLPLDLVLYNRVVRDAKKRFTVWPSAYASGWVVKTYKERGGKYMSEQRTDSTNLARWFREHWVDACTYIKTGTLVPCGARERGTAYCRPTKRITNATPVTLYEMSTQDIRKRCQEKHRLPRRRAEKVSRKTT
jgi:hypothetical protein